MNKINTHGYTRKGRMHSLYRKWSGMKQRCYNPSAPNYYLYGKKGITVCGRWLDSFETFLGDMKAKGWKEGMSIDRINNDGNYCPENCRPADHFTQNNNKTDNVVIEFEGKRMTAMEWSRHLGINYQTLITRYNKKWPIKDVLSIKMRRGVAFHHPPPPSSVN